MITEKQRKVIGFIEQNIRKSFTGTTKEEARAFISENMELSKAATKAATVSPSLETLLAVPRRSSDEIMLDLLAADRDTYPSNPRQGDLQFTHHKDMFGNYVLARNGDVVEDENYDYQAYADCMFSSM